MFKNNNKGIIKELAQENYQAHRIRNIMMILAITLTTIMITAVLTVGISFTTTMLNYGESAPGPGAHGSIGGTKEQLAAARELPQVNWAAYNKKCSRSPLRNEAFAGRTIWLMAPEEAYYEHNHVDLIDGHYPQNADEVIISDTTLEYLGIKDPVGKEIDLDILLADKGENKEARLTFTISGYFKNPLVSLVSVYDEIYTSEQFFNEYNPELLAEPGDIFVDLNNLNPLLLKSDVVEKLGEVNDLVDGTGGTTKHTNTLLGTLSGVMPALFFVIIIIFSGYFFIYNVFYISVAADIRWFGMMKTLGTTPKQLKQILIWQIRRLTVIGILLGSGIGYFIGNKLGPGIMAQTMFAQFYKAPNMLLVFVAGAIFVWLTVWLGGSKAIKTAARISPVEAARFTAKKKRNVFTVLSLALSGVTLMVVLNITMGYDIDKRVERYHLADAAITHYASEWDLGREQYQPIDPALPEAIKDLPYVKSVETMYRARTMPDSYEWEGGEFHLGSQGRIKVSGSVKQWLDGTFDMAESESGVIETNDVRRLEDGDFCFKITGLPPRRLSANESKMDVLDGQIDQQEFATGDYILWQPISINSLPDNDPLKELEIKAGDTFPIEYYNDVTQDYIEKVVTVMAVIEYTDNFGANDIGQANIVMPDHTFCEIYPDHQERISKIQIKTKQEITAAQNQEITELLGKIHNTQATLRSRYLTRTEEQSNLHTMRLIGLFLAGLLGIIGISNVVNTITSEVFARKLELAGLQSIGMTKKQLWKLLFSDTITFGIAALIIIIPLGGAVSYFATVSPILTGFSLPWFILAIVLIIAAVVAVDIVSVSILVKVLNRKSIVERLRDIE